MRTGGEEHLCRSRKILRAAAAPGTAMDEHEDWCRGASGTVNVELLDFRRSLSDALRLADT
jgi:hypothetical protein